MGWALRHIARLVEGETVQFRPRGHSMEGLIQSGSLVTVRPIQEDEEIRKGDIVLCSVRGSDYLHLIKAVRKNHYLIGNNHGRINGWAPRHRIYGKYISMVTDI